LKDNYGVAVKLRASSFEFEDFEIIFIGVYIGISWTFYGWYIYIYIYIYWKHYVKIIVTLETKISKLVTQAFFFQTDFFSN